MGSNTTTGIAQGAAAGATFGPIGAGIGALVGAFTGLAADKKAKQARKLVKKANALRTDAAMLRSFAEQRLLLRQAQFAQATALATGAGSGAEIESSGTQGVRASIQNQMYDNFLLGQSTLNEQLDANVFERQAGTKLGQAQDIMGMFSLAASLTSIIPHGTKSPDATTYGADSPNGPLAPSLESAFDTTLVSPGGLQTVNTGTFDA